jgi:hypothetical protein
VGAGTGQACLETAPDFHDDVFCGGHDAVKGLYFAIQKTVIHGVNHFLIENLLEDLQVEHHAGNGIGRPFHGHLDYIVVTMAVRIRVGPVHTIVLLVAPGGIPADVGGGKLCFTGKKHDPLV